MRQLWKELFFQSITCLVAFIQDVYYSEDCREYHSPLPNTFESLFRPFGTDFFSLSSNENEF